MKNYLSMACMALVLTGCNSVFYHPSRDVYSEPDSEPKIHIEEVNFASEDGSPLHGWYLDGDKNRPPRAVIVFFHGNALNLTNHYRGMTWLLDYGYEYFIFDYRGYGRSGRPGEGPTQTGTVMDGRSALRWGVQRTGSRPLVVLGQSLGGAVALKSVIDLRSDLPQLKMVVVDSTFYSYRAVAAKSMSKSLLTWPFQWLAYLVVSNEEGPNERISEISPVPIIVIHGDRDTIVDISQGRGVFERANEPKEIWEIKGGRHIDALSGHGGEYRKLLLARLDALSGADQVQEVAASEEQLSKRRQAQGPLKMKSTAPVTAGDIAGFAEAHRGCDSDVQCKAVAVGKKPCGGPQMYAIYSTRDPNTQPQMDELIARASISKAPKGSGNSGGSANGQMFGDCMMVTPPGRVKCEQGRCVAALPP